MDSFNDFNTDDLFSDLDSLSESSFVFPDISIFGSDSKPRISTDTLDPTTLEFVMSLDFDVEGFLNNPDNNYYSTLDINPIVYSYGIFDDVSQQINISVADIVGHDHRNDYKDNNGDNILHTFNSFFKRYSNNVIGDGYLTRALGLLDYKSGEDLLEGLRKRNNDTKDMGIRQIEDGKYIISTNGCHRFCLLRFFYLLDSFKKEKSEEELREIYTIPATLDDKVNYFKTYCNYLLSKTNMDIKYISFYCSQDEDKDKCTIFYKSNGEKKQISLDQLLALTQESVLLADSYAIYEIMNYYDSIPSFKEFIDTNIPMLIGRINEERERNNYGANRSF